VQKLSVAERKSILKQIFSDAVRKAKELGLIDHERSGKIVIHTQNGGLAQLENHEFIK
jgi:hypothetical protein